MYQFLKSLAFAATATVCAATAGAGEITRIAPGGNADRPFSEAVIHGGIIYLSGQLGVDPATGSLVEGGIGPETRQTLTNISDSLERLGAGMDDVIKCTVFLGDIAEWPDMNKVYVTFFEDGKPARSAMGTGNGIALGARVEIECLAAAPDKQD